jgi:hypothetical protein
MTNAELKQIITQKEKYDKFLKARVWAAAIIVAAMAAAFIVALLVPTLEVPFKIAAYVLMSANFALMVWQFYIQKKREKLANVELAENAAQAAKRALKPKLKMA